MELTRKSKTVETVGKWEAEARRVNCDFKIMDSIGWWAEPKWRYRDTLAELPAPSLEGLPYWVIYLIKRLLRALVCNRMASLPCNLGKSSMFEHSTGCNGVQAQEVTISRANRLWMAPPRVEQMVLKNCTDYPGFSFRNIFSVFLQQENIS